ILGSNGADLGIYALSDHYKVVGSGATATLQSLAGDVDYYYGGSGSDTLRVVLTAAEYSLVKAQLLAYATWQTSHKNSDGTYSFNFAPGNSRARNLRSHSSTTGG